MHEDSSKIAKAEQYHIVSQLYKIHNFGIGVPEVFLF